MEFAHIPVMLDECMQGLSLKDNGIYVDCTIGGAGHSFEILSRTSNSKLIGFDKDIDAIESSKKRLAQFGNRVTIIHDDFKSADNYLNDMKIGYIDGVLIDLGVSSYQLDNPDRGFSFRQEARLDMRMDTSRDLDAYAVVNFYSEEQLFHIIKDFGEERFAKKIAYNIVIMRNVKNIETTTELASIVEKSVPRYKGFDPKDAVRRVFQAIRIEVNAELSGLSEIIRKLIMRLNKGGRIAVLSFHSLEDRIVKQTFADMSIECVCPPKTPVCICGHHADIKLISRKPIIASEAELNVNRRSVSAKLRVAERI